MRNIVAITFAKRCMKIADSMGMNYNDLLEAMKLILATLSVHEGIADKVFLDQKDIQ